MQSKSLSQQISELDRWRADLTQTIEKFKTWLDKTGSASPEIELRVQDAIDALRSDRLTIAFVAEFSRGKTELINAIFFADYKRRLLPSTAGRTTMCPTELFYDENDNDAYVKLLPIETRTREECIADLKDNNDEWIRYSLDVDSPEQMANTLKEIIKVKIVSIAKAKELGLVSNEDKIVKDGIKELEIPVWRHALISFPHPLLKQGLVILDTPGLNALGTEPELTLSMLPNAQAVIFVLGADTGVTRSDLDMWQYYIKGAANTEGRGVIATLNKIDTLWDELMSEDEVADAINTQRLGTAAMLGLKRENVLTVSAQKALLAKTKGDAVLLEKSKVLELEAVIAEKIIPMKKHLIKEQVSRIIGNLIRQNREVFQNKLISMSGQLMSLKSLSGRNNDVIKHLTEKTQEQQVAYNRNIKIMQSCKRNLAKHTAAIMDELSLEKFDYLILKTRRDMMESWTTIGLKKGMRTFFQGLQDTVQIVSRQSIETHEAVKSVYERFQKECGLQKFEVPEFNMNLFYSNMNKLTNQEEEFRNSAVTTMTEQSFVVKKFFISLVSHAREIFYQAHHDADIWLKEIMSPLTSQIHMHKHLLDQHLDTLCKITETKDSLSRKILELEEQIVELKKELNEICELEQTLLQRAQTSDQPTPASMKTVTTAKAFDTTT